MDTYQVSRITVRQAVEKLANENLVNKRPGKGTFITRATVLSDAGRIIGFEEDMFRRGLVPETKLLNAAIVTVSHLTAERLNMKDGEELVYIRRLRLANKEPISIEEVFLVHRYCPDILDGHDFESESVLEVLDSQYGIRIERAEQTISAMIAPQSMRSLLEMKANGALIYIDRISFSQLDIPIELHHIYYRADRYALRLGMKC
jgi:GntR family transcriptional regulator